VGQNHATSYIYFKNVAQLQYQKFDWGNKDKIELK
jgi:hypothetical protein